MNPAIDKSTTVNTIVPDKKLRCSQPRFEPGGGGVNVSRAIKKLGGNSTAVYLSGGYSGEYFKHLLDGEGIDSNIVEIEDQTRENLIVVDTATNLQYRFTMPSPAIKEEEWQQCLKLLETLAGVDYIVASGSLPEDVPEDIFARLAAIAKKINAKLIVDTSGEPLNHAIEEGLYMIKPNLGELSNLLGVPELLEEDAVKAAKDIIKDKRCELLVLSMGSSGAILVSKDIVLKATAPVVKKRSTVGAGDSMVAGMVFSLVNGLALPEMLRYGVAAGTAATMNPGTQLCSKNDVDKLYELVRVCIK